MPLPLAMMIPFMGIQSAVMAKQFGENFQYGKRRISAMSNDEFNKLTPKMIQDNANAELKAMIPSMQDSITDMRHFQEFMIKEMISTIGDLLRSGLGFLLGIPEGQINQAIQDIEHFLHGHPDLHRPEQFIGPPEEPQNFIPPPPPQTILPPTPPPPPPKFEKILTIDEQSLTWLFANAIGRVDGFSSGQSTFLVRSVKGIWNVFSHGILSKNIKNMSQAYPTVEGYVYTVRHYTGDLRSRTFAVHKDKIKSSHN